MVTLEELKQDILNLKREFDSAIGNSRITPKQIITVEGLSDISKSLGTIRAGEFLALSSGTDPQASDGTGTFMSALGRTFDSVTYHIGGVNSGEIQWGANSSDGTLMAGGNSVVLTSDGIKLDHTDTSTTGIIWKEAQDTGTYYPFIHDFSHPTGNTAKPDGYNLFIGIDTGNFTLGSTATDTYHGSYNTGMGYQTLKSITTAAYNVGIGYQSGQRITTGNRNTIIGYRAGCYLTTGFQNILIGPYAGFSFSESGNYSSSDNIIIGFTAGYAIGDITQSVAIGNAAMRYVDTGTSNIAIGSASLHGNGTSGDISQNVAIGVLAGYNLYGGDSNSMFGTYAGRTITTGNYNTFIGCSSGYNANQKVDASNSTAIGNESYTTANNQIVLGNSSVTAVATYGNYQRFANSTTYTGYLFVPLTSPLTSTSWDLGDSIADADYTAIDLSSVFSAPAGIKAILVRVAAKDDASAASTTSTFALGPTDDETKDALAVLPRGVTNSTVLSQTGIVPCNSTGDIYYRAVADGTLNVSIEIWGYWI